MREIEPPLDPSDDLLPRDGDRLPLHRPPLRQVRAQEDHAGENHFHLNRRAIELQFQILGYI